MNVRFAYLNISLIILHNLGSKELHSLQSVVAESRIQFLPHQSDNWRHPHHSETNRWYSRTKPVHSTRTACIVAQFHILPMCSSVHQFVHSFIHYWFIDWITNWLILTLLSFLFVSSCTTILLYSFGPLHSFDDGQMEIEPTPCFILQCNPSSVSSQSIHGAKTV